MRCIGLGLLYFYTDNNWHKLALVIHERQLLTSREGCELVEHYVLALLRQLLKSLNLLEIQKICHCDIKRKCTCGSSHSEMTFHHANGYILKF